MTPQQRYKTLNYSPASYAARRAEYESSIDMIDADVPINYCPPRRTPQELAERHVGEAERIAIRILSETCVCNRPLRDCITRLCADTACDVSIPQKTTDRILAHQPDEGDAMNADESEQHWQRSMAAAAALLVGALQLHRHYGDDWSLVDGVTDYHQRTLNAYAEWYLDEKYRAEDLKKTQTR